MKIAGPAPATLTLLFARAHRQANQALAQVLSEHGLSVEQWRVLCALPVEVALTVTHLAQTVGMRLPATSKTVERMVVQELLERDQDPADQRRVLVRATALGKARVRAAQTGVVECERAIVRQLGHWEAERLQKLLEAYVSRR